jgi:hypothetical protein
VMAVRNAENRPVLRRLGQVLVVVVLAWVTLWGMYRFRFNESAQGLDTFNRPLAVKIADLHRPWLQDSVALMARAHLFPRAYLWGLADILHVGIEGRVASFYFINRTYMVSAPFYFFPTILLVRLPLGLIALSLAGVVLALKNRTSSGKWSGQEPLFVAVCFGALMLAMLMRGNSSYAGIRHALFVVPPLALLGAAALAIALERKSRILIAGVSLATLAAMASAIPVMRPWEYYNELVGGKNNAWHYFSDEGLDSGQRAKEIAAYYHKNLEPKGETPYIGYPESYSEDDWRGVRSLQKVWRDNPAADNSDVITGTFIIGAGSLAPNPFIDFGPLRDAPPVERFGNLMIYRGTFALPGPRANRFSESALEAEYSDQPDLAKAEQLLTKALELSPKVYYRWIELGNILIQRGARDEAVRAYENAGRYLPAGDDMSGPIQKQIQRVSLEDLKSVPPLRNPILE